MSYGDEHKLQRACSPSSGTGVVAREVSAGRQPKTLKSQPILADGISSLHQHGRGRAPPVRTKTVRVL